MSEFGWTSATTAWLLAPAAGIAVTLVARWRMRRAAPGPSWLAAAARGAAVALAVAAAAGPRFRDRDASEGEILLASAGSAEGADFVVSWPEDAPDARAALETLRAAARAEGGAAMGVSCRREDPALPRVASAAALRRTGGVEPFVLADATAATEVPPEPAPPLRVVGS